MAFNISYVYHAIDKFTPVANKINRSVERTRTKFRRLKKQMDKTSKSSSQFGNAMGSVRSRVLALGAALTAGVGVKALVDFGAAMSKVKAVSGATNKEFKGMRMVAKELGATTVFSASQAASGMEFLSRAGFDASEIIKSMPAVLDLAASSALDLATAADITSNIMTGFGISASETNKVADIMATINASANTNVQQLGDAMKFVGPIANKMGQSIEVTAAAMGALSDAGLQGSMAGTGLRKVLSTLASPSKSVSNGLAALGVDLRKINPETNDLVTVLKELEKANLTAGNALQIFGERGGPAFSVLIDNIPKVEKLTAKLNKSAGAAKRMADIMRDNLLGAGKEAISAFEGLIITLGDLGLTRTLKNVSESITFVTRNIGKLVENFPNTIKFIALFISLLVTGKLALLAWAAAAKIATVATLSISVPVIALIGFLTTALTLIDKVKNDFAALQAGEHVRKTIQGDIERMQADTALRLSKKGVAAGGGASGEMNGKIVVEAASGSKVNSATSSINGVGGNLGVSMAGG